MEESLRIRTGTFGRYGRVPERRALETIRPLDEERRPSPDKNEVSLRTSTRYLNRLNARLEDIRLKRNWETSDRLDREELNAYVDGLTQIKPCLLLLGPFQTVAEELTRILRDEGWEDDGVGVLLSALLCIWDGVKVADISSEHGWESLSKKTDVEGKTKRRLHRHHPYSQTTTKSRGKTVSGARSIWARIVEAMHDFGGTWEGATAKSETFDESNSWPQEDAYAEDRAW